MTPYAVLTGDFVKSTQHDATALDCAMHIIEAQSQGIDPGAQFLRFRGDGWQIYLPNGGKALFALLKIEAALRSGNTLQTRISIALGTDRTSPVTNLAAAQDEAFQLSGRGLDGMPKWQRFAIKLPKSLQSLPQNRSDLLPQSLLDLIEFQSERWSREQAEAISLMLSEVPHLNAADIASRLGISRQAAAARLKGAGAHAIASASWAFYQTFHGGSWDE